MRLTVLGSGNAEHQAERASAGHLVQTPEGFVLLDFGPGCWRNLARAGVSPVGIRLVLVSHLHVDHWSDLVPLLFHQAWMPRGAERPPLAIFGPPGTRGVLETVRRTVPKLSGHGFPVEVRDIAFGEIEFGCVRVRAAPVPHVEDLASVAWRLEAEGRTLAYSGDCRASDLVVRALEGADVAVVEATFPNERLHPAHLTAGEAAELARQAGVGRLVMAHLSRMWEGRDPAAEAGPVFGGPVQVAQDLLEIEV